MESACRDVLFSRGNDMVSESLRGVVDVGVQDFLPVGVVEGSVKRLPVGVFEIPDVA